MVHEWKNVACMRSLVAAAAQDCLSFLKLLKETPEHMALTNYWTYWPYTRWMKVQASLKWACWGRTMRSGAVTALQTGQTIAREERMQLTAVSPFTKSEIKYLMKQARQYTVFSFKAFIIRPVGEMATTYRFLHSTAMKTFGHKLRRKPTKCKALMGFVASRHEKLIGLSVCQYHHLSVTLMPSNPCLCHCHYKTHLRCSKITYNNKYNNYENISNTWESKWWQPSQDSLGIETRLAQSVILCCWSRPGHQFCGNNIPERQQM